MMFKLKSLMPEEVSVIINKSTDRPFTSSFIEPEQRGTFLCRLCGIALYRSEHQFASSCGWPSFDDEIPNRIERKPDPDGTRTEIVCHRCKSHLGHVFSGESFTNKNLRHCVNQTSFDFIKSENADDTEEIIIGGGCFWGVQHILNQTQGVLHTEVGYIGGKVGQPSYDMICQGDTDHVEAVRVVFDSNQASLTNILKVFFEIHDPFQHDGQGVDKGTQYLSAIFCYNKSQEKIAQKLINYLENKYQKSVTTRLRHMDIFWRAEEYHQDYFIKHPNSPICHRRQSRF